MSAMKAIFCMTVASFLSATTLLAQDTTETKKDKTKLVFDFDARFSSIHGSTSKINGFKLGWENGGKRFGLGIYSLRDPVSINSEQAKIYNLDGVNLNSDSLQLKSNVGYLVFFWDQILFSEKKYKVIGTCEFGGGSADLGYVKGDEVDRDGNPVLENISKVEITVAELAVQGHYKFLNWAGVGAGFGYRRILSGDKNVRKAFSGPIGILKLKIFIGELFRGIFKKKKEKTDTE